MANLAKIARAEVVLIVSLLMLGVFFLALTGRMRVAGILTDKSTGNFDLGRLQLLVLTMLAALLVLTRFDHMQETHTLSLPSDALLYGLGGSQGLYLVRKYFQNRPNLKGE